VRTGFLPPSRTCKRSHRWFLHGRIVAHAHVLQYFTSWMEGMDGCLAPWRQLCDGELGTLIPALPLTTGRFLSLCALLRLRLWGQVGNPVHANPTECCGCFLQQNTERWPWTGSYIARMLICTAMDAYGHVCLWTSKFAISLPSFACLVFRSPCSYLSRCRYVNGDV